MKVNFYGININLLNTEEILSEFKKCFTTNGLKSIFFLNAHYYNLSCKDKEYKEVLNNSNFVLNDGIGVKIGLKLINIAEKENMNGTDLIPKMLGKCEQLKKNVFLLGGKDGVAEKAKLNINTNMSKLNIVGCRSGFFNKNEENEIINEIIKSNTDVLIIGMGAPIQEKWVNDNREKLKGVSVVIAGGAILDFIAGEFSRAPIFMRKYGLEWLFRLINEPRRLFGRYIIGNIKFLINIIIRYRKYKV